ncbi:MAG TPA: hypothetical protein VI688_04675, partial [Anaerolineales bacterium]|nr:hypothetical protein [Anaerolineales bacterium]
MIFSLLTACTPSQAQIPIPNSIDPTLTSPAQTEGTQAIETQSATPGSPTELERTLYSIEAVFDFEAHTLSANQSIRYASQSPDDMNQLILRSFAHNYGADLQITGLKRADGGLV